jgi:hypothetical protein
LSPKLHVSKDTHYAYYRLYHLKYNPKYNSICKLTGILNIVDLFSTSLSKYPLPNASQTAADSFVVE